MYLVLALVSQWFLMALFNAVSWATGRILPQIKLDLQLSLCVLS